MFCSFILSFIFFQVILSHFSIKTEMAKIGKILPEIVCKNRLVTNYNLTI
jgi:hypothetical protein